MSDLVSVIVPVYKVEDLLERCVDSILDQTYQNLQVILVDDGSPDRCGAMCDAYAARDSRVEVIHQQNSGLSAARNAGLARARGDFVTFVDSDDWLDLAMIETLLHVAYTHTADIAMCGYAETGVATMPLDAPASGSTHLYSREEALAELLGPRYVNMVVAWGKLYQRGLWAEVEFPVGRFHEDEFTTHRVLHRSNRVALIDAPLYLYWQREGSITATHSSRRRADVREAFRRRAAFLARSGLHSQAAETYKRAFWMLKRDRRRAYASADAVNLQTVDKEVRQLSRELGDQFGGTRLRFSVLLYTSCPGIVDTLARARGGLLRRNPPASDVEIPSPHVISGDTGAPQHAFLIFAHDKFDVLERLLHLLDDERNDIFLHLDKKAGEVDASRFQRQCAQSRLVFAPRTTVHWGDYSQVEAVLKTLAVAAGRDYAYFHILSGADLPLQSNDDFHTFFRDNAGKEFVAFNDFPPYTNEWLAYYYPLNQHLRSRRTAVRGLYSRFRKLSIQCQRRVGIDRTRSFGMEIKYGSDWFSITQGFALYLLAHERDIERIFKPSFNPVEYYAQTVLWNSPFRDSVFDLDDPYRSNMRLIDFKRGTGSSPHVWTMGDAAELLAADRLFARKFDPAVDREIIDVVSRHVKQGA